jgi:hypothetical protein
MNSFNLWLGMSQAFQADLVPLIQDGTPATAFPGLNQLDEATLALLRNTHDAEGVARLFKLWPGPEGQNFRVWSFYFNKPEQGDIIHDDIDLMAATYPSDFLPMGAWRTSDGGEVGTQYDEGATTGTPWWPVPAQVVNFMPDIMTDPGTPEGPGGIPPAVPPIYAPPIAPTDVNILMGQAPRDFTSFYP